VTLAHLPAIFVNLLRDLNFVHAVDLSFEDPRFESDLLYSRVFGRPEKNNTLDDEDLNQEQSRKEQKPKRARSWAFSQNDRRYKTDKRHIRCIDIAAFARHTIWRTSCTLVQRYRQGGGACKEHRWAVQAEASWQNKSARSTHCKSLIEAKKIKKGRYTVQWDEKDQMLIAKVA
jgi:hypothetical protein